MYILLMKPRKIANICNTKFLGIALDNTPLEDPYKYDYFKIEFSMFCDSSS